jgi:hypothetical protein
MQDLRDSRKKPTDSKEPYLAPEAETEKHAPCNHFQSLIFFGQARASFLASDESFFDERRNYCLNISSFMHAGLESAYSSFVESFQPDPNEDLVLNWIAEQFVHGDLPPYWSDHVDNEHKVYYFDALTRTSQWSHPLEDLYASVITFVKSVRIDNQPGCYEELVSRVEEHLIQAQESSLEQIDGWSGPYASVTEDGDPRDYFYNSKLGISTWDSPLVQVEFELSLRHVLLMHALFGGEEEALAENTSPDFSDKLKLPLHLLKRDNSSTDDLPPSPSSSSYYSARSPHHSHRDFTPPPLPT